MLGQCKWLLVFGFFFMIAAPLQAQAPAAAESSWTACGWGGGGFYWSTVFDPTKDGVIYMGGDVDGLWKSDDHGQHWRFMNNGLAGMGVYSLAVDPHSETVFAGTTAGLCKSSDGGAHWALLPKTAPKDLRLTGERNRSRSNIAVDPSDANVIYVGSPAGGIFKSKDGGQTWDQVYTPAVDVDAKDVLRIQIGKVNGAVFGGFWFPLTAPTSIKKEDCQGLHLSFKAEGALQPAKVFLTLTTSDGIQYQSKNLAELFTKDGWQDVLLKGADLAIPADFAKENPARAKDASPTPDWPKVNRMDFVCVNGLETKGSTVRFKDMYFALAAGANPDRLVARDFSKDKFISNYGNSNVGGAGPGGVCCVAVAAKSPNVVLAASEKNGILLSSDAGQTWRALDTPKTATSVAVAATDANIIYGSFGSDGIYKSTDQGKTWINCSTGLDAVCTAMQVTIAPDNADHVYAIGNQGWGGFFYRSDDGGQTWTELRHFTVDFAASPVSTGDSKVGLSSLTNISINPLNPQELFISANWHSLHSDDGGKKLTEADRGADISCIYDVRFHGGRVYACAMDEGTFVSGDDGQTWRNLWPKAYSKEYSGHNWRLAISDGSAPGLDHIVATLFPWEGEQPNRVVVSDDGGKTYGIIKDGLPNYLPTTNTMWGTGYARALAADPHNPRVLYLGIDGDATKGHSGGGIFKSEDGGNIWEQLEHQPGCRRMFFGLAVDPTDSKRIYWGCCGTGGGLWESEDGGDSWQHVFSNDSWVFNVMVTDNGDVYCPGKNLWRSTDHGKTWKQLTHFTTNGAVIGLAADPGDPKTLWASVTTWDDSSAGGVFKTSDGGTTWQEITGDLPCRKPLVLRFDPATRQLWAAGPALFKIKQ